MVVRIVAGVALIALMAGCAVDTGPESSLQEVAAAAFDAPGSSVTLFTMVNNRSGAGGHTALLVNGSQQVIFDPAGSFRDPRVVERGDVLYGMTPGWVQAYRSAHARNTHHVVSQKVVVTPEQAETLLRLIQQNGSVAGAYCANSTSGLLSQVDGFTDIKRTFYPANLMRQFAQLPGVTTEQYFEDDAGNVADGVAATQ